MTAADLKAFRSHYRLTTRQASRAVGIPQKTWWRIEHGFEAPPHYLTAALDKAVREIERLVAHLSRLCQYCRKDVARSKITWAAEGKIMHRHPCPYCGRTSTLPTKQLMAMAVPVKPEVLHNDALYRQTLDKLKLRGKK